LGIISKQTGNGVGIEVSTAAKIREFSVKICHEEGGSIFLRNK